MSDAERQARGARDRRAPCTIPDAARRAWAKRAEELERSGMRMIAAASRAATVKSRANGQQMSPKLAAGLKLLEAADRLWARLGRIAPERTSGERAPASKPRSLASYRQQRQDGA